MKSPRRIFALLGVLALFSAHNVSVRADQSISTVSPFLPRNGSSASMVTENSPLELRGIISDPAGTLFGLYDPVKNKGGWAKLSETGKEFTVRSYDEANDAVTVEYQGRVLTVALKTAKVESISSMPMQQMPPSYRPMMGPPQVSTNAPADDARRLEAVAAEIARRRMMRQSNQANQANQPNQPNQQPAPSRVMPPPLGTPGRYNGGN